MGVLSLPASTPDSPRHGGTEQRKRWGGQVGNLQECRRQHAVLRRGDMELADVPVDEPSHRRARTLDSRVAQVVAERDVPGNVDDLRGGAEESARKVVSAGTQAALQYQRFQ